MRYSFTCSLERVPLVVSITCDMGVAVWCGEWDVGGAGLMWRVGHGCVVWCGEWGLVWCRGWFVGVVSVVGVVWCGEWDMGVTGLAWRMGRGCGWCGEYDVVVH